MITTPPSLSEAAVLRPIAPSRTSIDKATTERDFDIMPPGNRNIPEVLYLFKHQCQEVPDADLWFLSEKPQIPGRGRLKPHSQEKVITDTRRLGLRNAFYNSTVVL